MTKPPETPQTAPQKGPESGAPDKPLTASQARMLEAGMADMDARPEVYERLAK